MLGEVLTAIVTPFREDGSVDLEAFRSLCGYPPRQRLGRAGGHRHDGRGADAVRRRAARAVRGRRRRGRRPGTVVAGTGTYSTAHSIHLTERAHEIGVDGFLVVTPYYNKPPQRGIVAHVEAIAAVTDRPVVFYDIPSRVVVDAEPATISRLAEIENVRAVKQAKPSTRGGAPRRRVRAGPLRGRRRPDPAVPRGRGRRGHLRPHARRRPEGEGADRALSRGRRRAGPRDSTRSSAPRSTSCVCRRTRSRSSARSSSSVTRSAGCGSRWSRPTRRRRRRSATASSSSASSAHLRSDRLRRRFRRRASSVDSGP